MKVVVDNDKTSIDFEKWEYINRIDNVIHFQRWMGDNPIIKVVYNTIENATNEFIRMHIAYGNNSNLYALVQKNIEEIKM